MGPWAGELEGEEAAALQPHLGVRLEIKLRPMPASGGQGHDACPGLPASSLETRQRIGGAGTGALPSLAKAHCINEGSGCAPFLHSTPHFWNRGTTAQPPPCNKRREGI